MPIGDKILKKFRNLKPDAQPQPASEQSAASAGSAKAETHEYENKDNSEKPKFFSKKKKNKKSSSPPDSPLPPQGAVNAIHIVNSSHVHLGTNITNNIGTPPATDEQEDLQEEYIVMTPAISALLESQIKPQHSHLECVSRNLGRGWKRFFRSVGYTQGHIETVEENEAAYGVQEVRYKLLIDWKQNDEDGTLGALSRALWKNGHRSVVQELASIVTT